MGCRDCRGRVGGFVRSDFSRAEPPPYPGGSDPLYQAYLSEYGIRAELVKELVHRDGTLQLVVFRSGEACEVQAMFTTRGDASTRRWPKDWARRDLPNAAGCVTPANCQMIIAVGQGAMAAQAIDRDLFDKSLQRHQLPRMGTNEAGVAGVRM